MNVFKNIIFEIHFLNLTKINLFFKTEKTKLVFLFTDYQKLY